MTGMQQATQFNWQSLRDSAISRRHSGDVGGAIEDITRAVALIRTSPQLAESAATMLNYLADMYLDSNAVEDAETAIREAVEISRSLSPILLAANLWILAEIQSRRGEQREALTSAEGAHCLYEQEGHSHGKGRAEELIKRIKSSLE
jgi:tetratricopeptide (TPR) repeat protein